MDAFLGEDLASTLELGNEPGAKPATPLEKRLWRSIGGLAEFDYYPDRETEGIRHIFVAPEPLQIGQDILDMLKAHGNEYVVTDEFIADFPANAGHFCGYDKISNGKFKFEKMTLSGAFNSPFKFGNSWSSTADTGTQRFYIGRGGLCFADGASQNLRYESGGAKNNATVRIEPWHGDYTIHTKGADNPTDFTVSTVTYFGTTDESGDACTVTDDGVIASWDKGEIHIDGKGTFVVNAVGTATCAATVEGSATLAINAGKKLTTGAMTVNSGATLKVAQSGTVTLGGNLTLENDAILGFNFTSCAAEPVLAAGSTGNRLRVNNHREDYLRRWLAEGRDIHADFLRRVYERECHALRRCPVLGEGRPFRQRRWQHRPYRQAA